jgi:antitoxin (DNA-binding transcriptional repressor) of toxin-antitoxin stability system
MRLVSLREFRTRGAAAIKAVPAGETILLSGQKGPAYFLVPVQGDVIAEDLELRRAIAKASLRQSWLAAEASGAALATDEEIDAEIAEIRKSPDRPTMRKIRARR